MRPRYLVTGAQGFVGRYLVSHLLEHEPACRVLGVGRSRGDRSHFTHQISVGRRTCRAPIPAPVRQALQTDRYSYRSADINQIEVLSQTVADFRPHAVFHLASALWGDPIESLLEINVRGVVQLLQGLAASGVPLDVVVLGSSGAVYGRGAALPLAEDVPPQPRDLYGVSKLAAEHAARVVGNNLGLNLVVARLFNLVGPGQAERHVCGRFASRLAALTDAGVLETESLEATRDFSDVRDAVAALTVLAHRGQAGRVYNVASGRETPIRRVLAILQELSGFADRLVVRTGPPRPGEVMRQAASTRRIRALGFRRSYPLERSLADVFAYYREQLHASRRKGRTDS